MENKPENTNNMGNGPLSRLLMWFLLVLAAIGVPVVTGAASWQWALQHPLLVATLLIIYELLVLLAGLVKQVWGLQQPIVVNWLNLRVIWFFSRYYRKYRKLFLDRYRVFDIKGSGIRGPFTLEVEEVFVELSVAPKPPDLVSPDPTPVLPRPLREGRHLIWEFLQANQHLAILGAPGSGKTTLLQHITLTLLKGNKRRKVQALPKLPILLFLREHIEIIVAKPDLSLAELVHGHLKKQQHEPPQGWFEHQLKRGRCLVLLDGLDEVADSEARQQVVRWVETQMQNYEQNHFLLTSRPFGYPRDRLSSVTILEVRPFTSEQITQFVQNWYRANEIRSAGNQDNASVQLRAREEAQELLQKLRDTPDLIELAVNPLLLTMITTVHRYYGALPGKRVDLYAKACEIFAGGRQAAKGIPLQLSPAQVQSVLQPLAYHLMCLQQRDISLAAAQSVIAESLARVHPQIEAATFLKLVENDGGLLLERESGVYGFAHLTFQEYLAAVHIKEHGMGEELMKQVNNSWWHEAIRLYVAQTDATPVIEACLAIQPLSANALSLAIECTEEAREVQPAVRTRVQALLEQGIEDKDLEQRHMIAEILLRRRLRQMVSITEDVSLDTTLITCAEYQLFLDEYRAQGKYLQPDHWLSSQFPQRQGKEPVLGVSPFEARMFCEWLTQREPGIWRYRLPIAGELEMTTFRQHVSGALTGGNGYWVLSGNGCECVRGDKPRPAIPYELVSQRVAHDLGRALARPVLFDADLDHTLASTYSLVYALASLLTRHGLSMPTSALVSALDQALTSAHDFADALTKVRTLFPPSANSPYEYDRAFARARALALTLASDLARAETCVRDLTSHQNSYFAFDSVLTHDLLSDLNRATASLRELDHVLARAHALSMFLTLKLNRTRARDLAFTLNIDRDQARQEAHSIYARLYFASDLAYTLTRARDFANTPIVALACRLANTLTSALARPGNVVLTDAKGRDFSSTLRQVHRRNRALDLSRFLARVVELDKTWSFNVDNALNLIRALDIVTISNTALERSYASSQFSIDYANLKQAVEFLRWYLRFCILALIVWFLHEHLKPRMFQGLIERVLRSNIAKKRQLAKVDLIDGLFEAYLHLAILEERIQGMLPAFESILIVKERKQNNVAR